MEQFIINAVFFLPPFLLAISFHESAHAYVANRLGDPTAKDEGRITLNPIHHIDLMGLVAMFVVHFGWAKPVPVNSYNLRHPRKDNLWISLAGPVSNFILAIISAIAYRLLLPLLVTSQLGQFLSTMIELSVSLNLVLMVFNLFPLPPLDGFHILEGLVSTETYIELQKFQRYGPMILMGIIILSWISRINIFGIIFSPVVSIIGGMLLGRPIGW